MVTQSSPKKSLTPAEAAERLRVSRRTVFRMIMAGYLPVAKGKQGGKRIHGAQMDSMIEDELLRPNEVARILNVSRSVIYQWFWEGKAGIKGVKIGRTIRIFKSSLKPYLPQSKEV